MRADRLAMAAPRYAVGVLVAAVGAAACDNSNGATALSGTPTDGGVLDGASDATAWRDAPSMAEVTGAQASDMASTQSVQSDETEASVPQVASFAWLRFANWSPDSPSVDFCVAPHGTAAFIGPIFSSILGDSGSPAATLEADAGAPGEFPLVSAYVPMAPATYDVRAVVLGAANCAAAVAPDATGLPPAAAGAYVTVALVGEAQPAGGAPSLRFALFHDDLAPGSSTSVQVRFINASPSVAQADFGTGAVPSFKPLFLGVPFGQASTPLEAQIPDAAAPLVDSNGYVSISAPSGSGVTLSAYPSTANALLQESGAVPAARRAAWAPAARNVITVVLVGETSPGAQSSLLQCVDNAGLTGSLSDCK
jgi:hypothetical protein